MIYSKSICIFPLGRFAFTILCCKAGQSTHALAGLSLPPNITASCVPVALCIARQYPDNNNNGKMSCKLTCSSEEVKCLISIWAGDHFLQMMDTTKTVELIKSGTDKFKRAGMSAQSVLWKDSRSIKVRDHTVHIDQWSFGACWCLAEHIKAVCSSWWVAWVLTANKLPQG